MASSISRLTSDQQAILNVLKNSRGPLSTRDVANLGGMDWYTAKRHLHILYKKRKSLHTKKKGRARLWYLE